MVRTYSWFPLRRVPMTHSTFSYVLVEENRERLTSGYLIGWHAFRKHGIWILVGIVVVEELVVIISVCQFERHSFQEHIDLINSQDTVVQFDVCITRYSPCNFCNFFYPIWIIRINLSNSSSDWFSAIQIFWFNWFWFSI